MVNRMPTLLASRADVPLTLDCEVLRDLYGTEEVASGLRVARARAGVARRRARARRGRGRGRRRPGGGGRAHRRGGATRACYDLGELREGIAASKHPLVPLIRALVERCGDEGGWVHWGATTQDIVDTALVLQARAALVPIGRDLERSCRAAACALALRHRETPMAGRTHSQHAVPITFGLKAATWADELERCRVRLDRAAETAATTPALRCRRARSPRSARTPMPSRRRSARRLGLARADVHWHATRDRLRDLGHALSEIACAAERIACRDRPAPVDGDR